MHRRAHAVAIAEIDVIAHADLIAVVDDRRTRHREQQAVHQLDLLAVVFEQWRQAPANAEIQPRPRIPRVHLIHVVAFLLRHHLERQLVVITEEDRPLAVVRYVGRLRHDFGDRMAVLLRDRHVHSRHQRKVIRHMAFVAVAEIIVDILRPLVGLGEQHSIAIPFVDQLANLLDHRVRLGQVFVARPFALAQVGNRIQAEPVDADVEPELHRLENRLQDARIVEVEIGLMAEEAMPVMRLRDFVPCPIRLFGVGENDSRARVLARIVAPDVIVALDRPCRRAARGLEPRMLIRRVVDDQFRNDAQTPAMRFADKMTKILTRSVSRIDVVIIGDVIAVVAHRRWIERQQPDCIDAELLNVVELLGQSTKVADPVIVRIEERLDVELVDDRVLVPERVVGERRHVLQLRRRQRCGVQDDRHWC